MARPSDEGAGLAEALSEIVGQGRLLLSHRDVATRPYVIEVVELDLATGQVTVMADGSEGNRPVADGPMAFIQRCPRGDGERLLLTQSDGRTREIIRCEPGPTDRLTQPAVAHDGQRVAVVDRFPQERFEGPGPRGAVVVFDAEGQVLARLRGYTTPAFLSDGDLLVAGTGTSDGPAWGIYRVKPDLTSPVRVDPGGLDGAITSLHGTDDARRAFFVFNHQIWTLDLQTGAVERRLTYHAPIRAVAPSPDGDTIAFVTENDLRQRLADPQNRHRLHLLIGEDVHALPVAFAAAGPMTWSR